MAAKKKVKGFVINNSTRARHIYQRRVFPGGKVSLDEIWALYGERAPKTVEIVEWLYNNGLPKDWDVVIEEVAEVSAPKKVVVAGQEMYRETLEAKPVITDEPIELVQSVDEDSEPHHGYDSLAYAPEGVLRDLTAKQIYSLRIKDDPQRAIKAIDSIHKLRRALALCKNDSRKTMLTKMIKARIKELVHR